MGCCLSKKPSPSPLPSNGTSCTVKPSDPIKPVIELLEEETEPKSEKLIQEEEVLVIKHRRSHEERSKKTESDKDSPVAEKPNSTPIVRISSCTKEEVDAILIQCGKLSRSNSAAKTRRYSGSKRSFDFDQNERIHGGDAEEEEGMHRNRHRGVERVNGSPRERRRRTPSRERERSGSRERGNNGGGGGGSRRVSRSPAKRSEVSNANSCGSSVNSSNNRPGKFVTIPATDKSNNAEPLVKRITVKRNIGDACRVAASPRSKSPARAGNNVPSLSRSNSRKAEQSPYRRNPLGEIDQNSSKVGSCNTKKMIESVKPNSRTSRGPSPSRATVVELTKPPQVVLSRSRSLRKSRDFDLVSNEDNNYTALLLKDIQNFHGKSVDDNTISLPLCVTKACSIVEAVADLNSMTNNTCLSSDSSRFRFTSTAKKADLMEPSFEKYVTVKRGGSLEESSEFSENSEEKVFRVFTNQNLRQGTSFRFGSSKGHIVLWTVNMATNTGLEDLVNQIISVITNDGRNIVGVLKGFDQATNIILDESHERVFSTKEGVQQHVLGLYIIRGDNIGVIGELDEELDAGLDLSKLRAHPLKPVVH
ncbi:unnamed protein product [Arabidopsis halleri]